MFVFSKKINKKYAFELVLFNKIRSIEDGISLFLCNINLDLFEADHKPSYSFNLIVCNFMIFELNIYNIFHIN